MGDETKSGLFFTALMAVTIAPLVLLPLSVKVDIPVPGLQVLMFLTGVGHVAFTSLLLLERRLAVVVARNYISLLVLPGLLIALFVALWLQGDIGWVLALHAYLAWQLHHYQRQNYGLVAFAAAHGGVRVPAGVSTALNLATAAGFFGYVGNLIGVPLPVLVANTAWWLGTGFFVAAVGWMAAAFIRDPGFARSGRPACFAVIAIAFFLPALLSDNLLLAFWTYAMAHGAQYLIFTLVASETGDPRRRNRNLLVLGLTLPALYLLSGFPPTSGVYMGLVCAHFLIDAKLWRMRESVQSEVMRERFAFVFARSRAGPLPTTRLPAALGSTPER